MADPEAFAEFGELAARTIGKRNAHYAVVAGRQFACEESRDNALGRVADQQANELRELSEAGDTYEQLGRDLVEAERRIAQAEAALENVPNVRDERRLCVWALAGSLSEAMPELAAAVEHGVRSRISLIEQEDRAAIGERITELHVTLGELSLLFEAASQPWPLATAHLDPESSDHEPGSLNGNVAHQTDSVETFGVGTIEIMPAPIDSRSGSSSSGNPRAERIVYEQRLSEEIALHLVERAGEIVDPGEIAEAVYSPDALEIIRSRGIAPRNLITSVLGPESGACPRSHIWELGYKLQYGWSYKTRIDSNGNEKKFGPRYRAYMAIERSPDDIQGDEQEEFVYVHHRSRRYAELVAA